MENETYEEEALIVYESLKSDVSPPKAKKRWEILRRAILQKNDITEKSAVDILPALKAKARETRERKRKLQAKLATIIETAREELETAELKAEKVTTTFNEVVTDLRRKITIAEHRKIIENVFAGGQSTRERRVSVNDVAQGMRIVRQMEATHDRIRARKNFLKKVASKRSGNSPIVGSKREEESSSVDSKREDEVTNEEDKRKGGNVPSTDNKNGANASSAENNRKKNVPKIKKKKTRQGTEKREKVNTLNKDGEKKAAGKASKGKEDISSVDSKTGETISSAECIRDENVSGMGNKREEKVFREEENGEEGATIVDSRNETENEGVKGRMRRKGTHKNGTKIEGRKKDGIKGKQGRKIGRKIKNEKESISDNKKGNFDGEVLGEMKNDFGEVITSMGLKRSSSKPAEEGNGTYDKGIKGDLEEGGQIITVSREIQKHHKNRLKDEIKNKMKLPSVSESLYDDEDGKSCGNKNGNNYSFENDHDVFHENEEQDFELNGIYNNDVKQNARSLQDNDNNDNNQQRHHEKKAGETHPNDIHSEDETLMAETFGRVKDPGNQSDTDCHKELFDGSNEYGINSGETITEFDNKFENDTRHFTSPVEFDRKQGDRSPCEVLQNETTEDSGIKVNEIKEDLFIKMKGETKDNIASIQQKDGRRLEKEEVFHKIRKNMEASREFIENLRKTPDAAKYADIFQSKYRKLVPKNKEMNDENKTLAKKYGHESLEELSEKGRDEDETEVFDSEQKRRPSSLKMPRQILQDFVLNNRVQRTRTYAGSSSFDLKNTSIKELFSEAVDEKEGFETMTSASSPSGTATSPFKRSSKRDSGYCESTLSSLVLTGTYSWTFNQNSEKDIKEIFNGLRETGLDARADELEDTLANILEIQKSLKHDLRDIKKSIEDEKIRQRNKEREGIKIRKMKIAYERFTEKERERREFEELQRLLREEAKRRLERHQKLHRERMMLAIDNNISRQYNFSYFSSVRNTRRRKESDQKATVRLRKDGQ